MRVTDLKYDSEADSLYVRFTFDQPARSVPLDDLRLIDYSEDGGVIGIEFIDVSGGIDLRDIPFSQDVEEAIRARGPGFPIFA